MRLLTLTLEKIVRWVNNWVNNLIFRWHMWRLKRRLRKVAKAVGRRLAPAFKKAAESFQALGGELEQTLKTRIAEIEETQGGSQ